MQAEMENRGAKWRKLWGSMAFGALFGAAGAAGAMAAIDAGLLGTLGMSQEIALLVALMYLLMGLAVGFGLVSPEVGAKFLNVEDADELREQRASLVPSAFSCVTVATGLAVLALSGEGGAVAPEIALAVFVAGLALTAWLSRQSLRRSDELMQAVMRESGAASFYLAFFVIGGWAVLAHLGFAPAPAMLDVVTLFHALALVAAFLVIGRRGMMVR